jgi:hypothetical protein
MNFKQKFCRAVAYPVLWPVIHMPGESWRGKVPELRFSERRMRREIERIVRHLSESIGERHTGKHESLLAAEQFCEQHLTESGYQVEAQLLERDGVQVKNLQAEKVGSELPQEIVVFGAHDDTVPGSPGADDNATGVAALLLLARKLRHANLRRTVRFVIFANEERPNGVSMGSHAYAERCKERGENIVAMVSLEMLGFYSEEPGSQKYPFPFSLLYPDVGNFIGFVGNLRSRTLVRQCVGAFRRHCHFPSEGAAVPEFIRDAHRSDHWSFWRFGYPALMVTDTSNFRNRLYHTLQDTPAIIDFAKLARVTAGLVDVAVDLANG